METGVSQDLVCSLTQQGAEFAEVFAEESATGAMTLKSDSIVESISGVEHGLGLCVQRRSTRGFAHSVDTSPASLRNSAEAAMLSIGLRAPTHILDVPLSATIFRRDGIDEFDREHAARTLLRLNDHATGLHGRLAGLSAMLRDETRRTMVVNSSGVAVQSVCRRRRLSVSVTISTPDGTRIGRASVGRSSTSRKRSLQDDELSAVDGLSAVDEAVRRALARTGLRPAPTGKMSVILAAGTGAVLIHEACGHGLEGDHHERGSSVFSSRLGSTVAVPELYLVDDATLLGAWGSYDDDDDGHPARPTNLIEAGVLTGLLWDRHHGSRVGRSSANGRRQNFQCLPSPRMSNTLVRPGPHSPEDIIADTAYGLYVARLGDGRVNTATGAVVFHSQEAYLVRKGRICEPVAECSIIGFGPDILRGIDGIGTDFAMGPPSTCGKDGQTVPVGYGQPTLRVRSGLTVGGTAR